MFKLNGSKLSPLHEALIERTIKKPHIPLVQQPHSSGWRGVPTKPPTEMFKKHAPHNILAKTEIK